MDVNLFDFHLPDELIAQAPLANRSDSRLLVLNKKNGEISDSRFENIGDYLQAGDVLVLNDTKVLSARLFGVKEDTGAKVEVLLLKQIEADTWEVLIKPAKRVKVGTILQFGNRLLTARCVDMLPDGARRLQFSYEGIFYEMLDELGEMPLPPYIKEQLQDKDRYQTVFAKHRGSAAAPTAGLHFTEELLRSLQKKGIHLAFVTLHVGLGTFRPVSTSNIFEHTMHAEFYEMTEKTAKLLNEVRASERKIIAVGTTAARTLETIARKHGGTFVASSGWTDLFIYPGYEFSGIDELITNFHLPKSTLVMLVSALCGREKLLRAYEHAVEHRYRFFSFGDAMLVTERGMID